MSAAFGSPEQCPLCTEPLDATERAVTFCPCGFNICRFCWKKLLESDNGCCPHCREPYDETKVALKSPQSEDVSEESANKKKKKKGDRKRPMKFTGQERKDLQDLRILQRNLVYAVGLSLDICFDKTLSQPDYFGQYGPIKKISVNRSSPYSSGQSRNGPTGAAYVTFERNEDAAACVSAIDGTVWDGHYIRACFGTTKYCQAFLKGAQCNNPDCLYMHHRVTEGTFTKEEMNSGAVKGQHELYHLINFDRSKGPVPGSLAKPPKGPTLGGRRDSQIRHYSEGPSTSLDRSKTVGGRQEQDWPQLQSKGRGSCELPKMEKGSIDLDKTEKSQLLSRKTGGDLLWSVSSLRTQSPLHSSAASVPVPPKKSLTLSSPGKLKMITSSRLAGGRSSSVNIPNSSLVPKLSTESNLSHVSLQSDEQGQVSRAPCGRYAHPHEGDREILRETKSATPVIDDIMKDRESIQTMLRRRTSVPEHLVDEVNSSLLSMPSSRRGPPPGFERIQGRLSSNIDTLSPSEHLLQTKLSHDATLHADAIQTLTQNLMEPAKNIDFNPELLTCPDPSMDCTMAGQQFVGSLQSPFVAGGFQAGGGGGNLVYPLGYDDGNVSNNSLIQSLMSTSAGIALLPGLAGTNSQQLSTHGSIPAMQNRLSADAIDRDVIRLGNLTNAQDKGQNLNSEQVDGHTDMFRTILQLQEPQPKMNLMAQQTSAPQLHPLNDPAILAFKKSGDPDLVPMNFHQNSLLANLKEQQQQLTGNSLNAGGLDCSGMWGADPGMPPTPFLMPNTTSISYNPQQQWMDQLNGSMQNT